MRSILIANLIFWVHLFLTCTKQNIALGETIEDVQSVLDDILLKTNYNKRIRGEIDQTQATKVAINISLLAIQNINEVEEWMEVAAVLVISWTDYRLKWDPNDYNGTKLVLVGQNEVWRPEIILNNPATSVRLLGDDRLFTRHYYTGFVAWAASDIFRARCSIDVTSFPWDRQICNLRFVPWGYFPSEVMLAAGESFMDTVFFQESDVWQLVSYHVQGRETKQATWMEFYVILDRRALFFVTTIVLPTVSLCFLNLFVFLLPVESGERTSFSITVLLSIAVFLTLIGDHLPPSAETMASICYFLFFVLLLSSLICFCSILSLRMYHKDNDDKMPPRWIQKILYMFNKKKKREARYEENSLNKVYAVSSDAGEEVFDIKPDINYMVTWKEVSKSFDIFCFVIMTLFLLFSISMYTFHVVNGRL